MWLESFQWVGQKSPEASSEGAHKQWGMSNGTCGTPIITLPNGADVHLLRLGSIDRGGQPPQIKEANGHEWVREVAGSDHEDDIDIANRPSGVWPMEKDKILLGPYEYSAQQPGKDIRGRFIAALNSWLDVPHGKLTTISKVVSMLHTASLLVDDIEDSSLLRRGAPAAHSIFGSAQTINSANYVYVLALREVRNLSNPAATDIYTDELLNLHRGQGLELFWRDTLQCPSEEKYVEMVENKTGGLFRLAARLMQNESNCPKDCVPLVNLIGIIFQICDDYLNLQDAKYSKNKGLCEDITEGKFSFPIIHSIRSKPDSQLLMNVLRQKSKEDLVKQHAVCYMRDTGSFLHTQEVVSRLYAKASKMIDDLDCRDGRGCGSAIRGILGKIVEGTLGDRTECNRSEANQMSDLIV